MPTYRSIVPITTQARKLAAYAKAADLFHHATHLGVDVTRVQFMPATQFIEVDTSGALSADQLEHLSLTGPV